MTWCHFWTLAWHEPDCFNFFTFQPNYFEISCLLSLSQHVPKSFLEHRICRMLIDVTWKKSFEVNRFLCCWASLSASLGCVVWISEKGMRCAVFPGLMCLAWTYFCTPPSLFHFLCLFIKPSIWKTDIFRSTVWEVKEDDIWDFKIIPVFYLTG